MLTESIPVKHKTDSHLGAGIIVGVTTFSQTDTKGALSTSLVFLVCWENHETIVPHPNSDLTHLMDVETWFEDYFGEDNNDDEIEEVEFSEEDPNDQHTENEEGIETENAEITLTPDQALNQSADDFREDVNA